MCKSLPSRLRFDGSVVKNRVSLSLRRLSLCSASVCLGMAWPQRYPAPAQAMPPRIGSNYPGMPVRQGTVPGAMPAPAGGQVPQVPRAAQQVGAGQSAGDSSPQRPFSAKLLSHTEAATS